MAKNRTHALQDCDFTLRDASADAVITLKHRGNSDGHGVLSPQLACHCGNRSRLPTPGGVRTEFANRSNVGEFICVAHARQAECASHFAMKFRAAQLYASGTGKCHAARIYATELSHHPTGGMSRPPAGRLLCPTGDHAAGNHRPFSATGYPGRRSGAERLSTRRSHSSVAAATSSRQRASRRCGSRRHSRATRRGCARARAPSRVAGDRGTEFLRGEIVTREDDQHVLAKAREPVGHRAGRLPGVPAAAESPPLPARMPAASPIARARGRPTLRFSICRAICAPRGAVEQPPQVVVRR